MTQSTPATYLCVLSLGIAAAPPNDPCQCTTATRHPPGQSPSKVSEGRALHTHEADLVSHAIDLLSDWEEDYDLKPFKAGGEPCSKILRRLNKAGGICVEKLALNPLMATDPSRSKNETPVAVTWPKGNEVGRIEWSGGPSIHYAEGKLAISFGAHTYGQACDVALVLMHEAGHLVQDLVSKQQNSVEKEVEVYAWHARQLTNIIEEPLINRELRNALAGSLEATAKYLRVAPTLGLECYEEHRIDNGEVIEQLYAGDKLVVAIDDSGAARAWKRNKKTGGKDKAGFGLSAGASTNNGFIGAVPGGTLRHYNLTNGSVLLFGSHKHSAPTSIVASDSLAWICCDGNRLIGVRRQGRRGRPLEHELDYNLHCLAIDLDGSEFVGGGHGRVHRFAFDSGKLKSSIDLDTVATIRAVAFVDAELVACGASDGTVTLVDMDDDTDEDRGGRLEGHPMAVVSIACDPNGRWLATGDIGGTVILWDLHLMAEVDRLAREGRALAVMDNGDRLAVADGRHICIIHLAALPW